MIDLLSSLPGAVAQGPHLGHNGGGRLHHL